MICLYDIVEQSDGIRITITSDFVAAVREKVNDPDYAAAYEQDRTFGFVFAKTISQDDGSVDLVVDARVLSPNAKPGEPERMFKHEAHHIAIAQRGESLNDIRERHGFYTGTARGTYASMAGIACEEFRVESVLCREDNVPGKRHLVAFDTLVQRFDEHVRMASCQYEQNHDVKAVSHAVGKAFHGLATFTGYVAAELNATADGRGVVLQSELEATVLGDPWRAVVNELNQLSPAHSPTPRETLDEQALAVANLLDEWLEHIGFAWEDLNGDELYFHVLKPTQWVL